jgi:hypothetical protein
VSPASQLVDGTGEARPGEGRGRPRAQPPRPVQAIRSRLRTPIRPATARSVRREEEAGGFVLLPTVPPGGALAHSARDLLTVDKDHQGTEPHSGFLKAPVLVKSLFVPKPERLEALGLGL